MCCRYRQSQLQLGQQVCVTRGMGGVVERRVSNVTAAVLCVYVLVRHKPGQPVGRTWIQAIRALAHLEKRLLLHLLQVQLVFKELGGLERKKKIKEIKGFRPADKEQTS